VFLGSREYTVAKIELNIELTPKPTPTPKPTTPNPDDDIKKQLLNIMKSLYNKFGV
jgi:hypothetical protein